jgi:hypothetical protein
MCVTVVGYVVEYRVILRLPRKLDRPGRIADGEQTRVAVAHFSLRHKIGGAELEEKATLLARA